MIASAQQNKANAKPAQKWCLGCCKTKPPSGFYPCPYTVDRLTPLCRECIAHNAAAGHRERAARRAARVVAP